MGLRGCIPTLLHGEMCWRNTHNGYFHMPSSGSSDLWPALYLSRSSGPPRPSHQTSMLNSSPRSPNVLLLICRLPGNIKMETPSVRATSASSPPSFVDTRHAFLIIAADRYIFPLFWNYEAVLRRRLSCCSRPTNTPQHLSVARSQRSWWSRGRTNCSSLASSRPNPFLSSERFGRGGTRAAAQERSLHPLFRQPGIRESLNGFPHGKLLRWARL
jgi:hypothetical protein